KVLVVIVDNGIIVNPDIVAGDGVFLEVEDDNPRGILLCEVSVHLRVLGVLDLEPRDVRPHRVVTNNGVLALTHVQTRVRRVRRTAVFDQYIRGLHGVDTIGTVIRVARFGPCCVDTAEGDTVARLHADAIFGRI